MAEQLTPTGKAAKVNHWLFKTICSTKWTSLYCPSDRNLAGWGLQHRVAFPPNNKINLATAHRHTAVVYYNYLLCFTSLVLHSRVILCHIFCDVQLLHVFFHYLTPGLLWPTYWPSTFHPQLHHFPKYTILIPTFYMTNPSQPNFP